MDAASDKKHVRLLPEQVANQIAAGEVVERPASVLKELMENSLDAGAGRIAVEVQSGGKRLIRVVDDGAGMEPDDLLLSLERHATSKLSSSDDLLAVGTLGFRGEALPSIAAVSRMVIRSRPPEAETGSLVEVAGGSIRKVSEVGCPVGTLVEVKDLFFNIPARRKFLKSQATENAHLGAVLVRMALASPQAAIKFSNGPRLVHDLAPAKDLAARAAALLGRETAAKMTPIHEEVGPLFIRGLAGSPSLGRANYDQVYTYINGRFVRDKVLLHAIGQAYLGLMPQGRRPVVVLHISLDPALVDVNVHPAKIEVRFRGQQQVHDALMQGLRKGLAQARQDAPPQHGAPRTSFPAQRPDSGWQAPQPQYEKTAPQTPLPAPEPRWRPAASHAGPERWPSVRQPEPPPLENLAPSSLEPLFGPAPQLEVLAQLHGLYILCSSPRGLVIIDQHAAHERMNYENMKQALKSGGMASQGLLSPVTLELGPQEARWAKEQAADWARLGLVLEPFGGDTWLISSVPPILAGSDPAPQVRDLLSELNTSGVSADTPEFIELALRSLACQASIKAGQRLSRIEMEDLVARVAALPPPVTCPHGRPVLLTLEARELARQFKRTPGPAQ